MQSWGQAPKIAAIDTHAPVAHTHTMESIDEKAVQRFESSAREAQREFRRDPQKARDFLIRAGIAQLDPATGRIELVPQLRPAG